MKSESVIVLTIEDQRVGLQLKVTESEFQNAFGKFGAREVGAHRDK